LYVLCTTTPLAVTLGLSTPMPYCFCVEKTGFNSLLLPSSTMTSTQFATA
jgi:hypothetical protein